MKCVESVTYSIMINDKQCENIKPTRGLRQGDPLSPYLFLLCVERFSGLLNKAKKEKKLQGMAADKDELYIFLLSYT